MQDNKSARMWKNANVDYFKVSSLRSSWNTEKNVPILVQNIYCVDQDLNRSFPHKRHDCHYLSQLDTSLCTIYSVQHDGIMTHVTPKTAPLKILFV